MIRYVKEEARNHPSPEAATALSELIDATRVELEAAKEPQDQESAVLRDGVETRVFATHRYARFPTTVDVRLIDGASGPLYAGEVPYSATVIATDPQTVTFKIMCSEAEELALDMVRFEPDSSWLLEYTLNCLIAQLDGSRPIHEGPALQSIGRAMSARAGGISLVDLPDLNSGQRKAIEIATSITPAFIWGPPGTGKTQTLAALAQVLTDDGRRILVVASANVAVDTALNASFRRLADQRPFEDGRIVRVGDIAREDVRDAIGKYVLPAEIVARRFPEYVRTRDRLIEEIKGVEATGRELSIRLDDDSETSLSFNQGSADELVRVQSPHALLREQLRQQWRRLKGELDRVNDFLHDQERKVIAQAPMVFTTAWRSQTPEIFETPFDAVLLDEAATVPAPLAWMAASCSTQRVIAFGDFRQIPPIERDSSALKGIRFSDDIYALNSIPELVLRQAPVEGLSVLTEQYRMPVQLASLVSAFAYPERPLTTPQFIEAGSVLSPKAVVTIDTASIVEPDQRLRISLEAKGRTNSVHASLVAMCVTRLIDSGDLNPDWITDQLAILAPYRKQVSELRRVLSVVHGRKVATAVTTIHRMQGHERPFIILDLVHSEGSPLGRLMQGTTILDKGPRILNVAISRAQRQLIVIADLTHISGQGGQQSSSHIGSGMQRLAQLLGPTALPPNIVTEWTLLP